MKRDMDRGNHSSSLVATVVLLLSVSVLML